MCGVFFLAQGDRGEPGLPGDKGERGEKVRAVFICHSCPSLVLRGGFTEFPVLYLQDISELSFLFVLQGFRGLPGRIGSPGLDGKKVRP